jgi:sodium transport system permease protein
MKMILVVAAKEMRETLRDKRTLFFMVVFPLITFPVMMSLVGNVTGSYSEKEATKTLRIGLAGAHSNESVLMNQLKENETLVMYEYDDTTTLANLVKEDSLDIGLYFDADFSGTVKTGGSGKMLVYYQGRQSSEYDRFKSYIDSASSVQVSMRLADNNLPPTFIKPYDVQQRNVSSIREILGTYAGGILPYFFITFCFLGCLYPAIDMFAGEKERGTLETLLTAPVARWKILLGKMLVVIMSGMLSATLTMVGLFVSLNTLDMPSDLIGAIYSIVTPPLLLTVYAMMIPLTIFFAGVMIPVSVYSRSFKEAQSTLTPLNLILVLPAVIGLLPGFELNWTTAFIPVVNIVLATKDIIAGNVDAMLLTVSFVTLLIFAAITVLISFRQFGKETNIIR